MATRKGIISDLVRGWDTTLHTSRMLLFSLLWVSAAALTVLILISSSYLYLHSSTPQRQTCRIWLQAGFWHLLSMDRTLISADLAGNTIESSAGEIFKSKEVRKTVDQLGGEVEIGLIYGAAAGGALFLGVLGFAFIRGRRMRRDVFVRGGEFQEALSLAQGLRENNLASDVSFGPVPLVSGSEPQHIFISGTPGTGKSVLISSLLDKIRERGDRAIIYDSSGDYLSQFWRDGDKILNPLDSRSEAWTPWADIRAPYDADRLAEALIPVEGKTDPFWAQAARQLLAGALMKLPVRDVSSLLENLLTTDLSTLAAVVEGTDAAALLGEQNEKMALSVRATMATYVRALRFLRAGNIDTPFSIRDWVDEESSHSWLYVTSRADQHTALRPLITCFLDTAASAIMSLPPSRTRRIWIVLDELPRLHKMPSVPQLLAMGRKYGACGIMGIQTVAQLREIYAKDGAEALTGMASSWVVFRTPDPETADWTSKAMGETDLEESNESISYSAEETRDGVSLRAERKTRRVVMPTEIMTLPNLQAYLRLPGEHPITRIPLVPVDRPIVMEPYSPTDLSLTAWGRLENKPVPPLVVAAEQTAPETPAEEESVEDDGMLEGIQEEPSGSESDSTEEFPLGLGDCAEGGRGWH